MAAALILAATAACNKKSKFAPQLQQAQQLLNTHADSAFAILDAIDQDKLTRPDELALWAVLHTRAKDKLDKDISGDSALVADAVEYYRHNNGPDSLLRRAYYMLGRVNFERKDVVNSILCLLRAEELVDTINTDFYEQALLYQAMSDVYHQLSDIAQTNYYCSKAIRIYKKLNMLRHAHYCESDLASNFTNGGKFTEAITIFNRLLDYAYKNNETPLLTYSLSSIAGAYIGDGQYAKADSCYNVLSQIESYEFTDQDKSLWILAKRKMGGKVSVEDIEFQCNAEIERIDGLYTNVISNQVNHAVALDSKLRKAELNEEIENNRLYIIICVLSLLIAILLFAFIIWYRRNRTKRKIYELYSLADKLSFDLSESQLNIKRILENIERQSGSSFKLVDRLLLTYYERKDIKNSESSITSAIEQLIADIQNDPETFNDLINHINGTHDGLIFKFDEAIPDATPDDKKLFIYLVLGFNTSTICLLFDDISPNNYRVRKNRLKSKISKSESPHTDRFLKFFRLNQEDDSKTRPQ